MADIEDNLPPEYDVLLDSLRYVQEGKTAEAFEMVENALQEGSRNNQVTWLRTLYEHGAIVAHIAGDRRREIDYKEQALQYVK
jgi:hypothetical protein